MSPVCTVAPNRSCGQRPPSFHSGAWYASFAFRLPQRLGRRKSLANKQFFNGNGGLPAFLGTTGKSRHNRHAVAIRGSIGLLGTDSLRSVRPSHGQAGAGVGKM